MKTINFGGIEMSTITMDEVKKCDTCNGTREIEIMGGTGSDEWGVVNTVPCDCNDL